MVRSNRFDKAFSYVYGNEQGYVNDRFDSGGPTNFGITIHTLGRWRGKPVTESDVKNLEIAEAKAIMEKLYWKPIRADEIVNDTVLIVFFDASILFGVVGASKAMQLALISLGADLKADGAIGPKTVAAINSAEPKALVAAFSKELKLRIASIFEAKPETKRFKNGWTKRLERYALV